MGAIGNRERIADVVVPMLVIAVYLSLNGKGFLTVWPILVCTVFALVQPFVRFFLMDRLREPMEAAGKGAMFLAAASVLYAALAMVVVDLVT